MDRNGRTGRKAGLEGGPVEVVSGTGASDRRRWGRFGPDIAVVLLVGLFLFFWSEPPTAADPVPVPESGVAQGIQVYFTASPAGADPSGQARPEVALVRAIDLAQHSVDVAVYALNLSSVSDALRRADRRGVRVRMVVESDNAAEDEVQALVGSGIQVRQDGRPGLMHHKFVVIDGAEVWTGSMNLTISSTRHDDNNLLRIQSRALGRDFAREFDEMFEDDRFGPLSLADTPLAQVDVAGMPVEVLFSPDDGAADRILRLLDSAESSLDFAAFSLTSDSIADHMLTAASRGVRVRGVMETTQSNGLGSEYDNLRAAGLDVRLDGNPFNMHHKLMIIDGAIVVTGSYNFTASAEESNDENLLIFHDAGLARRYIQEFVRLFEAAGRTD